MPGEEGKGPGNTIGEGIVVRKPVELHYKAAGASGHHLESRSQRFLVLQAANIIVCCSGGSVDSIHSRLLWQPLQGGYRVEEHQCNYADRSSWGGTNIPVSIRLWKNMGLRRNTDKVPAPQWRCMSAAEARAQRLAGKCLADAVDASLRAPCGRCGCHDHATTQLSVGSDCSAGHGLCNLSVSCPSGY